MSLPDAGRWAAFLGILLLIALVDLCRRRPETRRWREYSLPLIGAAVGAAFGLINDSLVTCPLSADYFTLGKGIAGGEGFDRRVAWLGIQAGFGAGVVAGALFLYVNRRESDRASLPLSRLVLQFWKPLVLAVLFAALLPFCFASRDPLDFRPVLVPVLRPDAVRDFLRVWWIHVGLYLGLLAGLAWGAVDIHRGRAPRPTARKP